MELMSLDETATDFNHGSWIIKKQNLEQAQSTYLKRLRLIIISFAILSPFLIISLIIFAFLSSKSSIKSNSNQDDFTPEIVLTPTPSSSSTQPWIPEVSILISTNNLTLPLSDGNMYEWVKLQNGIEILFIKDNKAVRSGLLFSVDISPYTTKYDRVNDTYNSEDFPVKILSTFTNQANAFRKYVKKEWGNYKYSSENNIHWYYMDFQDNVLNSTMLYFYNMIYHNVFTEEEGSQRSEDDLEFNLQWFQTWFHWASKTNIVEKYNNKFIKAIDDILFGESEYLSEPSWLSLMKNLWKMCYRDTSRVKWTVISNSNIRMVQREVIPIWSQLKKQSDKSQDKEDASNNSKNNIKKWGKYYYYHTQNSLPTYDLIIPCDQNINQNLFKYAIYMINDSTKDSWPGNLKNEDWITKLSARWVNVNKSSIRQYLLISCVLTDKGLQNYSLITTTIQYFWTTLGNHEKYDASYNAFKLINQKKFQFLSIKKYQTYLKNLTFKLHTHPRSVLKDWMYSDYSMPEYNDSWIREAMVSLIDITKYSLFIGTPSEEHFSEMQSDSKFTWVHFRDVIYYTGGWIEVNNDYRNQVHFTLKSENRFITKLNNIALFPISYYINTIREYQPLFYGMNEKIPVNEWWYRYDPLFKIPRIEVYIALNYANDSKFSRTKEMEYIGHRFEAMQMLFFNRVKTIINDNFTQAVESGNIISVKFKRGKGIVVYISCYSDIIVDIVKEWFEHIFNEDNYQKLTFKDYAHIIYENVNEKLADYLYFHDAGVLKFKSEAYGLLRVDKKTRKLAIPYEVKSLYENLWVDYLNHFFKRELQIKALLYGVLEPEREITENIADIIKKYNTKSVVSKYLEPSNYGFRSPFDRYNHCLILKFNNAFWKEDRSYHYMISALFLGVRNAENEAMSDILIKTYKGIFNKKYNFDEENSWTSVEKIYINTHMYFKILKKSRIVYPDAWFNETTDELTEALGKIRNITRENFERMREHLLHDKERPPLTLELKAEKAWYELFEETDFYDRDEDYKNVLRQWTRVAFIDYSKEVIWNNMYLNFQFYADNSPKWGEERSVYNTLRKRNCSVRAKDELEDLYGNRDDE